MEERAVIQGFPERYTVTRSGRVYSGDKELAVYNHKKGYKMVSMYVPNIGRQKVMGVHRCVGLAWIPNPDNRPFVCHKNDIKDDNDIDNLYWGGHKSNGADAVRNGVTAYGERSNCNILTEKDVLYIRDVYEPRHPRYSIAALARMFNVSYSGMKKVATCENWSYLNKGHINTTTANVDKIS